MAKNALGKGLGALLHENTTFSESKKLQSLSENIPNAGVKLPENITVEDLKTLLLIIFNECLSKDEPNLLIKSYLTVTIGTQEP